MGCLFHVPVPSQLFPKFKRNRTNLVLEQAPQGRGHSSKPERSQEVFGQCAQAHGGILGLSCAGLGVGLNSCGSNSGDSMILWKNPTLQLMERLP